MDEKLLKRLLRRTKLVKYCYQSCAESKSPLWCANYLLSSVDTASEFEHITWNYYDLARGVYLYSCTNHEFKLIAIVSVKGIKVL